MSTKSPLQVQKNKHFKCLGGIKELIPVGSVVNCYPFYDGTMEFELAKADRFVVAHTNKYCIYEFWRCIMTDPARIAEAVSHLMPLKEMKMFFIFQDNFERYKDPFVRSAVFFVLNQLSDVGLVSSGKPIKNEIGAFSINALKRFQAYNFHIKFDNEKDESLTFSDTGSDEYILFSGGRHSLNLFSEGRSFGAEETNVNHSHIEKLFNSTDKKAILLYYPSQGLFNTYKDHNIRMFNKWGTRTNKKEECAEVLIANF